jgi:hypothetical protein
MQRKDAGHSQDGSAGLESSNVHFVNMEEKGYADLARELVWTKAELLRGEIARNLDQSGALATLEKKLAELKAT